jgi:hypothetical protein
MSKGFVDQLIHNMKLADMVAKAAPWMVEGIRDQQMNVRYVGIKLKEGWEDIFPTGNNILLKFVIDRSSARCELYVANKPPFHRVMTRTFSDSEKWETLLGEMKRILKRDKADHLSHNGKIGNLYVSILPHLK